jgi:predicted Zn-ribbon and HTH transcriptional regulator
MKQVDLLLSVKELRLAYVSAIDGKSGYKKNKAIFDIVNKTQCKKMYEYLNGICKIHKVKGKELSVCRIDCVQCNKELRKYLGIG